MNIHFVLRNTYENKDGLRQIQLVYCANNQQIKLDTSVRARIKDWNHSKQLILSSVSEIGKSSKELNDILHEKKNKVLTIVKEFKREHENNTSTVPDPDTIFVKERFNEVKMDIRAEKPLLVHLQEYIQERKSNLDIVYDGMEKDKRSGEYKTLSHYEGLLNDLKEFSEETGRTFYFRDIDKKFKESLIKFYLTKGSNKKKKKGLGNGTLKKKFSKLKSFLNCKTEDGVNKKLDYQSFSLKEYKVAESDDNIYALTIKEFEQFKNLPLKIEKLELARDYYMLSCATGLRWSDVCRLNKSKVKNGNITTNILKTGQTLTIPLNPISEFILRKYDFQLPEISKTEIDRRLKLLWCVIKSSVPSLNESTLYKYYIGRSMIEEYYPKYELLTFHTSRKYFISYLIFKGVPIDQIRKFSGHRGSLEVFFRYVYDGNFDPSQTKNLFTEKNLWNE